MKHFFARFVGPLAVVALAIFLVAAMKVPLDLTSLGVKNDRIRQLQEQNAALSNDIKARTERIEKLSNSPSGQELEIRKRLKVQRPGETIIILPDQAKK